MEEWSIITDNLTCVEVSSERANDLARPLVLFLIYTPPTFILNIFILRTFLNKKNGQTFRNSFYYLFAVNTGAFMCHVVLDLLCFRVFMAGVFCNTFLKLLYVPSYFLSFPISFKLYLSFVILYTNTLISVNRLTAVTWLHNYKERWSSHFSKVMLITFLLPFVSSWNMFLGTAALYPGHDGRLSTVPHLIIDTALTNSSAHTAAASLICATIIIICTIATVIALMVMKKSQGGVSRAEYTLFFIGLSMAVSNIFLGSCYVGMYYCNYISKNRELSQFFYSTLRPIATDLETAMGPWSLIILASNIRKLIIADVKRIFNAKVAVTPEQKTSGQRNSRP